MTLALFFDSQLGRNGDAAVTCRAVRREPLRLYTRAHKPNTSAVHESRVRAKRGYPRRGEQFNRDAHINATLSWYKRSYTKPSWPPHKTLERSEHVWSFRLSRTRPTTSLCNLISYSNCIYMNARWLGEHADVPAGEWPLKPASSFASSLRATSSRPCPRASTPSEGRATSAPLVHSLDNPEEQGGRNQGRGRRRR